MNDERRAQWPRKYNLFGVGLSATTYEEALKVTMAAAEQGRAAIVTHLAEGVVMVSSDPSLRSKVNSFEIVAPDGQPVRWALNLLHDTNLPDRVYSPELVLKLCRRAAEAGIGVYLYGSYPNVVERLRANLIRQFPSLQVVGCVSPPFRPLTPEEDEAAVEQINRSGAGLVFLGLGCPLQDVFAYDHRHSIKAVQVCVGAAFDFLAGNKKMAPKWMQRNGLEWLYRLMQEPRRLWRRYLVTNTIFLIKLFLQLTRLKNF